MNPPQRDPDPPEHASAPPWSTHPVEPETLNYAGTHTLPVMDNTKRAATAATSLKAYAILQVILYVAALPLSLYYMVSINAAGFTEGSTFMVIAVLLGLIALVSLIAGILAIIYYMMWQYRAFGNARAMGQNTRYTPGWSVGWWFIPIANLFVPRGILAELWQASGAEASTGDAARPLTIYYLWVGNFLLAVASAAVGALVEAEVLPPAAVWAELLLDLAAGVAWIGFLFLLVGFIRTVQGHQEGPGSTSAVA